MLVELVEINDIHRYSPIFSAAPNFRSLSRRARRVAVWLTRYPFGNRVYGLRTQDLQAVSVYRQGKSQGNPYFPEMQLGAEKRVKKRVLHRWRLSKHDTDVHVLAGILGQALMLMLLFAEMVGRH